MPMPAFVSDLHAEPAIHERQDGGAEGSAGGGLGRRRQAADNGAKRKADQRAQRCDTQHDSSEIGVADVGPRRQQRRHQRRNRHADPADRHRERRGAGNAEQQIDEQIDNRHEAEKRQDQYRHSYPLGGHLLVGGFALLHRHGRTELGIEEASGQRVGDVAAGEQKAGAERRRIEQVDGNAHDRAHHHQHDAGWNENSERAAGSDGARGEPGVVAGLDHHRRGHDAEHRDGRADDAGRHGEDGRRQDHRQIE